MHDQEEVFFTCPYCWQTVSMLVDLSVPEQRIVEDCEVCCNPIQLHVIVYDEEPQVLKAERA